MSKKEFWKTRKDGVVYAEPEEFITGYFIYPPHFEGSDCDKYKLCFIDINGGFNDDESYHFDSLELAKEYVMTKFKEILNLYRAI